MSGGMFDGLRNAEEKMARKEEKKLIAAEQEKIARKEEEEAVQELEDLDFGALGGGTNWADADESAELKLP